MTLKVLKLPELTKSFLAEVKILFQVFNSEILLVGGCVRDLLLKKKIADFDFATKLRPNEIIKILEENNLKAIPTGIKFGTITAVVNHKNFEITTLRKDNETDGRHCDPEFIDDFELDAARRDFTVNALYLDEAGNIYDYFDGISDLNNQEIKFIYDANKRIEEDYLRILRFFRFSCKYAKKLDREGLTACILQKENLKKLSRERIRSEFLKIVGNENKEMLKNFMFPEMFEGVSPYHYFELWLTGFFSTLYNISSLKIILLVTYPILKGTFLIAIFSVFEQFGILKFKHYLFDYKIYNNFYLQ
jgi:poly(A) polymerase